MWAVGFSLNDAGAMIAGAMGGDPIVAQTEQGKDGRESGHRDKRPDPTNFVRDLHQRIRSGVTSAIDHQQMHPRYERFL